MPTPGRRVSTFAEVIEEAPTSVAWHTRAETEQLLAKMSPLNKAEVTAAMRAGRRMVGGVYKRTRLDERGVKVQRAAIRFDDVAGCLRTTAGGSRPARSRDRAFSARFRRGQHPAVRHRGSAICTLAWVPPS